MPQHAAPSPSASGKRPGIARRTVITNILRGATLGAVGIGLNTIRTGLSEPMEETPLPTFGDKPNDPVDLQISVSTEVAALPLPLKARIVPESGYQMTLHVEAANSGVDSDPRRRPGVIEIWPARTTLRTLRQSPEEAIVTAQPTFDAEPGPKWRVDTVPTFPSNYLVVLRGNDGIPVVLTGFNVGRAESPTENIPVRPLDVDTLSADLSPATNPGAGIGD